MGLMACQGGARLGREWSEDPTSSCGSYGPSSAGSTLAVVATCDGHRGTGARLAFVAKPDPNPDPERFVAVRGALPRRIAG